MSTIPPDDFLVDVHTRLPRAVFKKFDHVARNANITVGRLLALVAEQVDVTHALPDVRPRRPTRAMPSPQATVWNADNIYLFRAMWEQGCSDVTISKELGCAPSTVRDYRKKNGIPAAGVNLR